MKYYGTITDDKDLTNKEYVDEASAEIVLAQSTEPTSSNYTNKIWIDTDTTTEIEVPAIEDIATDFSTSTTYKTGDYVNYNGALYRYTASSSSSGAWDNSKWTQVVVCNEIDKANDEVSDIKSAITINNEIVLDGLSNYQSDGIFAMIQPYFINASNAWGVANARHAVIKIHGQHTVRIKGNLTNGSQVAFLASYSRLTAPDYCTGTGRTVVSPGDEYSANIPNDCKYLYIAILGGSLQDVLPVYAFVDNYDFITGFIGEVSSIKSNVSSVSAMSVLTKNTVAEIQQKQDGINWLMANAQALFIDSSDKWSSPNRAKHLVIAVRGGEEVYIRGNASNNAQVAFLTTYNPVEGQSVSYATGTTRTSVGYSTPYHGYVPNDCSYVYFAVLGGDEQDVLPLRLMIDGYDYIAGLYPDIIGNYGLARQFSVASNSLSMVARLGYDVYSASTPPEQSIASYKLAISRGYRVLLCDVRVTSDGKYVCWHDAALGSKVRHSDGTELTDAEKALLIADLTLTELNDYDFGAYKSSSYAGTKILTLNDFLIFCKYNNAVPYIEAKVLLSSQQASEVAKLIKIYGFADSVVINSAPSYIANLENFRQILPDAYLYVNIYSDITAEIINSASNLGGKCGICVNNDYESSISDFADACANAGVSIGYSEVRTPGEMYAFASYYKYCTHIASRLNFYDYLNQ